MGRKSDESTRRASWIVNCFTLPCLGRAGLFCAGRQTRPPIRDMYSLAIYVGVGLVDSELSKSGEKTPPSKGYLDWGIGWYKRQPPYEG